MKGLKYKIGSTFILLLITGMVLTNVVMVMFWQRDMIRDRIEQLDMAAMITAERIGTETESAHQAVHDFSRHTRAICVLYKNINSDSLMLPKTCPYNHLLNEWADRAIRLKMRQSGQKNQDLSFWPVSGRLLFTAIPLGPSEKPVGALSAMISLKPLYTQLIANQKVVFLYIVINMVILTALGLLRMNRIVIRPIERLARTSDTYTDEEGFHFISTGGDDEFRRLSTAINQMLNRIEADKDTLKKTVASLRLANRQLKDTQQEMVRSEKRASVGRLAAGLAHEIGNPVGIIQGYLDLIGQDDIPAEEKKEYIKRADSELQRIGGLIRKLLEFSRSDRKDPQRVALHPLLRESIEMVRIQLSKAGVEIETRLDAQADLVFADPDQLRQVFLNTLLNALDALNDTDMEEKTITITTDQSEITLDTEPNKKVVDAITVRLADNGPGVHPDEVSKVFDPFFTTKEPGKGTGLGLFVSHTIVENSGGRMRLASGSKGGTVVTIALPLKK